MMSISSSPTLTVFLLAALVYGIDALLYQPEERLIYDDLQHRQKRAVQCEAKYSNITSGHTACLPPSSQVRETGVSAADKQLIVDIHNSVRSSVSPTASSMMKLTWDDEIANTAQRWAENCVFNHDSAIKRYAYGRFSLGQNLSWGSGWPKLEWREAIKLWSDEVQFFTYGGPNDLYVVGHFTQMVWADTVKIGCGYAQCDGTYYYVCNYSPAGNVNFHKPYPLGVPCAGCQSKCNGNLCDCGGKVCLNSGTMDLETCQCSCLRSFYMLPDCGLNCTNIQDPAYCPQYSKSSCIYGNIPEECPDMCGLCPTAAAGYGKKEDKGSGSGNDSENDQDKDGTSGAEAVSRRYVNTFIPLVASFLLSLLIG